MSSDFLDPEFAIVHLRASLRELRRADRWRLRKRNRVSIKAVERLLADAEAQRGGSHNRTNIGTVRPPGGRD